jgi:hypothetical protein
MLKRLPALLLAVTAALMVAGCGKKSSDAPASAATEGGRKPMIWHVGNGTEVQDLDPQVITGVPEHKVVMALFEGLVSEDPKDLSPEPAIAERWEISDDGLVYTFYLRKNARWSNGDPITSDDFIQSYKRMLTPALASEYSYLLWFVTGAEDYNKGTLTDFSQVGFKAPDPYTFVVTLKSPTPYLLRVIASHYAWWPVPTKVIAQFGGLDRKSTRWTRAGQLRRQRPLHAEGVAPNQKHRRGARSALLGRRHRQNRRDPLLPHRGHRPPRSACSAPASSTSPTSCPTPRSTLPHATTPSRSASIPTTAFILPLQRHPPPARRQARPPRPRPRDRPRDHREERHPRRPGSPPTP